MKLGLWVPLAGLVFACCGREPQPEDNRIDYDTIATLLTVEQLPPLPQYPEPHRGRLVTATAGDYDLTGDWDVQAGSCREIGIIEMYAGPSGLRTALLLHTPDNDPLGPYPVVAAASDFPTAPAALIAVQVYDEPEAYGFQAYTGELQISEYGERISGRFGVTLREIGMDLFTQFVGVFEDIPVDSFSPEYCQAMRDSTLSSDSVTAVDSALTERY